MPAAAKKAKAEAGQECPPLLEKWQSRVKEARKRHDERREEWDKNREYTRGTQHDDGKKGLVRTNLIYANQATIVPNVYAKNPEIAVTPSASVSPSRYRVIKNFASTLEIVIQRMLVEEARLKQRMRSSLYSIQDTGVAWLKMFYQRDYQEDPVIKSRINDAQDNLARLERLIRDAEVPADHKKRIPALGKPLRRVRLASIVLLSVAPS